MAGIGFRADRRYGLQRFRADLEANTYKYANESELDYSVFNYALAWDWSVTTKLHGVISANQKEYAEISTDPASFLNQVGKRTERAQGADAVYELGAAWRMHGWLRAHGLEQHPARDLGCEPVGQQRAGGRRL